LVVGFFAVAFFGAAFLVLDVPAEGAVLFWTRPDLVFPRTTAVSLPTAGAAVASAFRGLLALAFGLAAVFFVVEAVFLGAALVVAVFFVVLLGAAAFYEIC
jgi:hypothetical protein